MRREVSQEMQIERARGHRIRARILDWCVSLLLKTEREGKQYLEGFRE
jgi:hypothetical protein